MYYVARGCLWLLMLLYCGVTVHGQDYFSQEEEPGRGQSEAPDSVFLQLKATYDKAMDEKKLTVAAQSLQQLGQLCYHLGHYAQALDFHLQANDLFTTEGRPDLLADNLNDIGTLYYYNKQSDAALAQFKRALHLYTEAGNASGLGVTYGNIGHWYEKKLLYDSAFYFQRLALQQYEKSRNVPGMAEIYEHIGSIYEDLERYDSASHYFNKALELYTQAKDELAIIGIYNNLGDVLRKTGAYQQSLWFSRKAAALSMEANENYQLQSAYRDIAKAWHLLQRDDSSFYYQELSRKYLLDIYSVENGKQMAFLQVMNDTEKKDREILKLKSDHRNTVVVTVASIIVIVLLVILGFLVISRQRLKIKNEQALHLQQKHVFETQRELMESELKNKQLQEENLKQDLDQKARELSIHTLHVIQKNQVLEDLSVRLEAMVKDDRRDQKKQLQQIILQINRNFDHDQYWGEFKSVFEQVHQSFFNNLKNYADGLTSNDLKLVSLIKLNLSPMEIATLLGISQDSLKVARYRLRKKINMPREENLNVFIQSL